MGFKATKIKPLLVGELNTYSDDPKYDLYPLPSHASGGRLASMLGLSPKKYIDMFDRVNLCRKAWSIRTAREKAEDVMLRRREGPIVLLGRRVADAFGMKTVGFFEKVKMAKGVNIYLLPHPSGLCRLWNDVENVAHARGVMTNVLRECAGLTDG